MSTKERWKSAINWVNDNYESITSYLQKCLHSVCMDKDDYIKLTIGKQREPGRLCWFNHNN